MTDRVIRLSQLAQHNGADSLWVAIEGRVYDVTKFLQEHPGGQEVMLEQAGRDATIPFIDVGHSLDARQMAEQYLIGVLAEDDDHHRRSPSAVGDNRHRTDDASWKDIVLSPTWSNWLIPTAIAITVYVVYKSVSRLFHH